MKAFLDTNVLVAAFYGDHEHHSASLAVLTRFPKKDAACGPHSLAEVYANLTRMPGKHRINADQAMLFIGDIRQRLTIVGLTPEEYFEALDEFSKRGVRGGAIYDGILAQCAVKSRAEAIFTWNVRHYAQFGPDVVRVIQTPP